MSPSSLVIKLLAVVLIVSQELSLLKPSFVLASTNFTRKDFPPNFVFGSGVSAYQYEGAVSGDGRTPSTLDIQAYKSISNACEGYHKYKEDIQLMGDTALEAYRFSISWSRLLPNGKGPVNPKAVEYYNNVINGALKHGVQPHVIMMHLDPPQALEDAYGGWMNRKMVEDFTTYADTCFREFGDRVKHWTTINEPNCYVTHVSKLPFIEGHNLLLGHASAVELYRQKYKAKQHGNVGRSVSTSWYTPKRDIEEDLLAIKRVHHFTSGWFIDPVVFGDYPATMKQVLGMRLPSFSDHESKLLRGSFDFIGINSYGTQNVENNPSKPDLQADCHIAEDDGGKFLQNVLEYFKETYGNPPVYVHENGYPAPSNDAPLNDTSRVEYLNACIGNVLDAARNGSNVKGYFQWSFLDLFEIPAGYDIAYGLYYVDFNDPDLRRYPKLSAHWYSAFLKGGNSLSMLMQKTISNLKLLEGRERQLLSLKNGKLKGEKYPNICTCTIDEANFQPQHIMSL